MKRIDLTEVAAWLHLAAAPSFAAMAALAAMLGGPAMICGQPASPLTGMVPMYLLMSAFHAAPWLKLIAAPKAPRSASSAAD
ncbi:MAG TPA: hypothetical protein VG328_11440 [Stellaceae bacterium]|jgi:hypothetical protein|nr:hypothetical protein [Stellaceae bacterium]